MSYIGRSPQIGGYHKLDSITCDGSTAYTMQLDSANFTPESANHLIVSVNGVIQAPATSFTVSGSTITFASALSSSDTIDFIMALGNTLDIGVPSDGTVTSSKISYPLTTFSSTGIDDNASSTAMTINSSQNVAIGTTSPSRKLHVETSNTDTTQIYTKTSNSSAGSGIVLYNDSGQASTIQFNGSANSGLAGANSMNIGTITNNRVAIIENNIERMRFSGNNINIGTTDSDVSDNTGTDASNTGINLQADGRIFTGVAGASLRVNRMSDDGDLISFRQDGTQEGTISVSSTTVSYNGFTGTHWSRLSDNSKPTILKGTILESLDEMMDWYQVQFDIIDDEGNTTTKKQSYALGNGESVGDVITYDYNTGKQDDDGNDIIEQVQATIIQEGDVKHTKSKVSDTVDAKNVYGVFVDWDNDDDTVNDMYVAQTGTFVVRMNSAETVSKGDLIQSNGDGTGKVQADDIIRSSTVAKVLSTTKIETYSDGSYIVPCSLHC